MTLKLYNTKTRSKDEFTPIDPANVRMYVCGPTVYDYAHIGNARPVIVFDVLFRLLRHIYGESHVTYARNITDIEDKIIARAAKEGRTIRDLTEETAKVYLDDTTALGAMVPTLTPRATEHVDEMLTMIGILVTKGHAYEAEGHVLFDVTSMADYGKLSGRSIDDMIAGARVEVAPYKKNPMDFVLWKPSGDEEPGWDSAYGRGRPGWHIECSAMIEAHMGETIDIHGGGIDLVFPHHENEIAQSACTHGAPLANYWLHNGFLQVEGEKMSKSLGNFHTIHSLLADWPGEVLRLQMLQSHYRQPIDWTERSGKEAQGTLDRWYALTEGVDAAAEMPAGVLAALSDDINTPGAIAELHKLANAGDAAGLKAGAALLGFLEGTLSSWNEAKLAVTTVDPAKVEALIEERTSARAAKDFAASDRIRDELKAMGVEIKDGPEGTSWTVAK